MTADGPVRTCPDCGRPIPSANAKLCPACGYPLMYGSATRDQVDPGMLRKPITEFRDDHRDSGPPQPVPVERAATQLLGPHCPSCHHRGPAGRVRCEVCGTELWPGAATPPRRMVVVPPAPPEPPRRRWVPALLYTLAVVGGMALLYLVAYTLA